MRRAHKENHVIDRIGWLGRPYSGRTTAFIGGAGILKPTIRVTFWGAFAIAATAAIGAFIGKAV
ncbi:hypothetical protein [Telmatospirillum sp.]|uniref:hypothetical protein n=1 Tax=Telmatospirillum sp. TaxID=2079197 RepID=UPI00284A894E|nr:hypothetical protein [Telmatospirillum sp.]MDR3436536.1 hypothetical protein [Telmatospirillum sp.]